MWNKDLINEYFSEDVDYELDQDDIDLFFLNKRNGKYMSILKKLYNADEYNTNEDGHRSKDFSGNEDILIAGCSQTFGIGLNLEHTWPHLLSKKINKEYANVSLSGSSVFQQMNEIFTYIEKYGNPKIILFVAPNFKRIEMPVNKNFFTNKGYTGQDQEEGYPYIQNVYILDRIKNRDHSKYSKSPHDISEVFPVDLSYFLSISLINMLEAYCKVNGIHLVWGTTEYFSYKLLKEINSSYPNKYKSLIDLELNKWKFIDNKREFMGPDGVPVRCHEEFNTLDNLEFYFARDRFNSIQWAHWGFHEHIHIYEIFLNKLTEDGIL